MHPLFALSEKTSPLSLEMKSRPPTTTGCARAEPTFVEGNVAGVRHVAAPAVPVSAPCRIRHRRRRRRAARGFGDRRWRSDRTTGEELGDGFLLGFAQVVALPRHVAGR